MSHQTTRISTIDVGSPSYEFKSEDSQDWEIINVRFHGFEDLPTTRGDYVKSEFTCFGHRWRLTIFPGGSNVPPSDDGKVAVYLRHLSDESITIKFGLKVKNNLRKRKVDLVSCFIPFGTNQNGNHDNWRDPNFAVPYTSCFTPFGTEQDGNYDAWGTSNFTTLEAVIRDLVDGALIVEVRMCQPGKISPPDMPFIAENPLSKLILAKFMDRESSDVTFEVGGEEGTVAGNKRAKTSPATLPARRPILQTSSAADHKRATATTTTFPAHRFVLQMSSPWFAHLFESMDDSTIPITNVEPEIFRHLLYYTYGGKVADEDLKNGTKDIINAADRYGIVGLKLEAEATLVASTTITVANVTELLLYANEKNCALLKESVMDFLVVKRDDVLKNVSFDNVPGHLMKDLLTALDMDDSVRVNALRKRLHKKGLDIDGSREALVALLKKNS